MRSLLVAAAVGIVLAGCQSERSLAELSYPEKQQLAKEIVARCQAWGYKDKAGGEACVTSEIQREEATRRSERQKTQAAAAVLASGMQRTADQFRQVNCTSNQIGTSTYTNCY